MKAYILRHKETLSISIAFVSQRCANSKVNIVLLLLDGLLMTCSSFSKDA